MTPITRIIEVSASSSAFEDIMVVTMVEKKDMLDSDQAPDTQKIYLGLRLDASLAHPQHSPSDWTGAGRGH